jgi:hypothetical protein
MLVTSARIRGAKVGIAEVPEMVLVFQQTGFAGRKPENDGKIKQWQKISPCAFPLDLALRRRRLRGQLRTVKSPLVKIWVIF